MRWDELAAFLNTGTKECRRLAWVVRQASKTPAPLLNHGTNARRYAASAPPLNQVEPSTNGRLHPAGLYASKNRESGT